MPCVAFLTHRRVADFKIEPGFKRRVRDEEIIEIKGLEDRELRVCGIWRRALRVLVLESRAQRPGAEI